MEVICLTKAQLTLEAYLDLSAYRYEVFVNQMGWKLECPIGLEVDQFDGADTEYVMVKDAAWGICGCARLLPTTRPYLLSQVFPFLFHELPIPRDETVWEVSRFATWTGARGGDTPADMAASLAHTGRFAHAVLRRAAELGARRLVTVSPYGMERLLRRVGVCAHRVGPPVQWEGQLLIACWIDVEATSSLPARHQQSGASQGHERAAGPIEKALAGWALEPLA